jgi:hypothetical protein
MVEKEKNFNEMKLFKIAHFNLKRKVKEWYIRGISQQL